MKSTKSSLTSAFLHYRRARLMACAVLSVSALRTISASDDKDTTRRIAQLTKERHAAMDDSTDSADLYAINRAPSQTQERATSTAAWLLSRVERAAIQSARPASRSIVEHQPAIVIDEPLPADFVPASVEDYQPVIIPLSPEEEALARASAQFELDVMGQFLLLTA